jgi:hypothetical protein
MISGMDELKESHETKDFFKRNGSLRDIDVRKTTVLICILNM